MYVRAKRNKSGTTSIQILAKSNGKNRLIETIGCSSDPLELKRLVKFGKQRIDDLSGQRSFNFEFQPKESVTEDSVIEAYIQQTTTIKVVSSGAELVLGAIFDQIGFGIIKEPLFRDLVISRITDPGSKLKACEYIFNSRGEEVEVTKVYRFLDRFFLNHKSQVEEIAFKYTQAKLGKIKIIFYDMTTLYYEAEQEDDLRRIGYSKDGKSNHPQIMLGLIVGQDAYPIAYNIYEGNKFEGDTLLPAIKSIREKYGIKDPIVVADSGLLSKANLDELKALGLKFIIGARIKNLKKELTTKLLEVAKELEDKQVTSISHSKDTKLVISYSIKREKKDRVNREKGIVRLAKAIKSGKLTKQNVNNRGYNKFIKLNGEVLVELDQVKIEADAVWDGLKGYITNSSLTDQEVVAHYNQLWKIEKAFRISKTDLRIRPIYHRKRTRIEAHLCIAFVAYTVFKDLEYYLNKLELNISPQKAIDEIKSIYKLRFLLPNSGKIIETYNTLNQTQQRLVNFFSR
jgi:transposase